MNLDLQAITAITGHPLVSLVTFFLTVIGFPLGIYLFFRSLRDKKLTYQFSTSVLVEGLHHSLAGLTFAFNGAPQERVSVSKVDIWNAGRGTIDKSDIAIADPLRLTVEGANVLDAKIVKVSSPANRVEIARFDGDNFALTFDFLDHRDYVQLQIVHDGSLDTSIRLGGKIKGCKKIAGVLAPSTGGEPYAALIFGMATGIAVAALVKGGRWPYGIIGAVPLVLLILSLVAIRRRSPVPSSSDEAVWRRVRRFLSPTVRLGKTTPKD